MSARRAGRSGDRPGPSTDRGSGLLGTTFGVGVFLTLLYFSAQVLLNLWVMSTVDATTHDAALAVALSGVTADARAPIEAGAIERARAALGRYGQQVHFDFEPAGPHRVALRVRAPQLRLLPGPVADIFGVDGFDRLVVINTEETR